MRTALITGASRGIGRGIFDKFYESGEYDRLVIVSRHAAEFGGFSTDVEVVRVAADLAKSDGISQVVDWIAKDEDGIHVLINNAGELGRFSLDEMQIEDLEKSNRIHLIAPVMLSRAVARKQLPEEKVVVNIGSIYGSIADPFVAAYSLSKRMVPAATRILAKAYAPNVRVNAILPGHIDTQMTRGAPKEFLDSVVSKTAMGRLGEAREVAELVWFLCSDNARFITGQSIVIDGGFDI
jgi:NAD(P)-dependent dehydrogenase (short-subunit alcohol dehydrogenase family)